MYISRQDIDYQVICECLSKYVHTTNIERKKTQKRVLHPFEKKRENRIII